MFRTLGYQTDALAMAGRSTFEARGDYIVQRTPDEPNFWFGNQLIYQELQPLDVMQCAFKAAFPEASHMVLGFDIPSLSLPDWDISDLEVDHVDVLAQTRSVEAKPLPPGLELRMIEGDAWQRVIALQHEIGIEQGYPADTHLPFIQGRFEAVAKRCQTESFAWFGVFDGDVLVADMGITWNDHIVRYQNVETRETYRGRGICAGLLSHVSAFAARQAPSARQVIVADVGGAPGRIYRRAGFAHVESLYSVYKPGY